MILESEQTEAETFAWFALRVRSNYERVAAMHLRSRGIEEFSPTYKAESQWSDRKKQIDRSVFPGYVFCRVDPEDRLPVLSVPGVVNLVAFGKGPEPIPDHEIEGVRRLVASGLLIAPWPFLKAGQRVLIEHGTAYRSRGNPARDQEDVSSGRVDHSASAIGLRGDRSGMDQADWSPEAASSSERRNRAGKGLLARDSRQFGRRHRRLGLIAEVNEAAANPVMQPQTAATIAGTGAESRVQAMRTAPLRDDGAGCPTTLDRHRRRGRKE